MKGTSAFRCIIGKPGAGFDARYAAAPVNRRTPSLLVRREADIIKRFLKRCENGDFDE
jgi:hypothetical protein